MRRLVLGVVFAALAAIGFSSFISAALSATRDAKSATLSERFAPTPNGATCTSAPGPRRGSSVGR